jgi:hypothetical protein
MCDDDSVSVCGQSFSSTNSDEAMLPELASHPEEVHPDNVEHQTEVVYAALAPLEPQETKNDVPIDDENMAISTVYLPTKEAPSPADQDRRRMETHPLQYVHCPLAY